MKIKKTLVTIFLGMIFLFMTYRLTNLAMENHKIKSDLELIETNRDSFYGQLDELTYTMMKLGPNKEEIYNALVEYREKRKIELEEKGIPTFQRPPLDMKYNKFTGFHSSLNFFFNTNGKLIEVRHGKYWPKKENRSKTQQ